MTLLHPLICLRHNMKHTTLSQSSYRRRYLDTLPSEVCSLSQEESRGKKGWECGGWETSPANHSLHFPPFTFSMTPSYCSRTKHWLSPQIHLAREAGVGILLISLIHCNAPNILRTRFPFPCKKTTYHSSFLNLLTVLQVGW